MDPVLDSVDLHLWFHEPGEDIDVDPYENVMPNPDDMEEMAEYYGEHGIDDSFRQDEERMIKRLIGDNYES